MKKILRITSILLLLLSTAPAFAQKYKKAQDTVKLNKEFLEVSLDLIELNEKLQKAEADLLVYRSKSEEANTDAANAASASSDQASKATNGSVKEARSAKKRANKAYNEAKDSRSARGKLESQEAKIDDYKNDIRKKQERLEKLEVMRADILAKIPADPTIRNAE